jgi:hypothetical protein
MNQTTSTTPALKTHHKFTTTHLGLLAIMSSFSASASRLALAREAWRAVSLRGEEEVVF